MSAGRKPLRVLIADDRPTNLKLLRVMLQSEGHSVLEASDGLEVLRILEKEKADVVVSDILMPNMDGYRLCHEIRNDPRFRGLPVVLYTSTYLSPSDRKLAMEFGASAFLEKPAPVDTLCELLREVVDATAPPPLTSAPEDLKVLKQYSERLIKKIEEKNIELAQRAEQLMETQENFRQMAESVEEVFWMATRQIKEILYVSPAYERIWGRPCRELYDDPQSWKLALHPEDLDRVAEAMAVEKYLSGGYEDEFRIIRPDGSVRWIHNRAFPVRDAAGRVYRVTGVATDVTERRNLESQFRQAQKMEAVGRLAGGVAHDFNNLLTVINGFSQLILQKLDSRDPLFPDLEEINKAGEKAAGLTRQLLAFSRKQVLQPRVLSLNGVVNDMERMLRRLIGEDVELIKKLAPDAGSVRVDPGQIEQVVVNLAVNARDAMPRGGRLILETANAGPEGVSAGGPRDLPPGRYVVLGVEDTGAGMNDVAKAHLFEPFFTTKESGRGTGLGLSTVFGIIKQSGGHVSVESEVGRGTTFRIHLPRMDEPAESMPKPAAHRKATGGGETVLVVDDQESVRSVVHAILKGGGYRVLEAGHGKDAIGLAQSHPGTIHLVVTDLVMPVMGGPDLIRGLREMKREVRVVYMSGYTDTPRGMELPPTTSFLQKPFTPEGLLAKVREALDSPASAI